MGDVYKTLQTHPAHGSPPCLFSTNQYLCEGEVNQQDTSVGQRKILSPRQESNPEPPEHRVGALSTELREFMENKVIFFSLSHTRVMLINSPSHFITELKIHHLY